MKKSLSLLLVFVMLLTLLAGCAKEPAATDTPADTTPDTETKEPADSAEAPADSTEEPTDAIETPAVSGPLFEEPRSFTGWIASEISMAPNAKLNEIPGWQWIEEKTNVTMDWDQVSSAASTEQFNLMVVSGSYPDIIVGGSYTGGLQSYIDQEIIVDLAPYITGGYAPNYQALREADEDLRKDSMLDSGAIPVFYRILTSVQQSWMGLYAETGIADANGINVDELETLEDFHDLLVLYRDNGMEIPYAMSNNGLDGPLMSAFGISGSGWLSPFITVDGQIKYSFIMDEYYDYLKLCSEWYSEGLFETDFHGRTVAPSWDTEVLASGTVGMMGTLATSAEMICVLSGKSYRAIESPLRNAGDVRNVAQVGSCTSRVEGPFTSVTTACEDVEAVVKYLDWFYSDESYLHNNYGIEDLSYYLDETGEPHYTETFMGDTEYNWTAKMQYYAGYGTYSCLNYWENQKEGMPDSVLYAYNLWDANYEDSRTLPTVALTGEESEENTSYYSDISTYASEMVLKFIIGAEPLTEDSFADYVSHIEEMGIQNCIDIYQTAYERYLER